MLALNVNYVDFFAQKASLIPLLMRGNYSWLTDWLLIKNFIVLLIHLINLGDIFIIFLTEK